MNTKHLDTARAISLILGSSPLLLCLLLLLLLPAPLRAQQQQQPPPQQQQQPPPASTDEKTTKPAQDAKKANERPASMTPLTPEQREPFDDASVERMAAQCVRFETEAGVIELEMLPEAAPETVRNFLNLVAIGAYDTTSFSRVVPGFIVQGGNLATRERVTLELARRSRRTLRDEPNYLRHTRGMISMARTDEPNSATTHFFILVGPAPHLDASFSAFGRVTRGMDVVDAINKMPVIGDKPEKPVRLTRATIFACPAPTPPPKMN